MWKKNLKKQNVAFIKVLFVSIKCESCVNADYKMFCSEEIYEENIFRHWSRTDWRNFNRQNSLQWFGFSFFCVSRTIFFPLLLLRASAKTINHQLSSPKNLSRQREQNIGQLLAESFFLFNCVFIYFLLNYVLKCVIL